MARRRRRIVSLSIALVVLVTAGAAILLTGIGPAGALTPGEGTGKSWCASYDGTSLGSYRNVYACKADSAKAGKTPFDSYAGFQPTELANRFLYAMTGHTLFDNDVAGNFVALASAAYAIPDAVSSTAGSLPAAGDIISMWGGRSKQKENGDLTEVSIVTAVRATSAGEQVTILTQGQPSGAEGFSTISVSASQRSWSTDDGYYTSFEWLRLAAGSSVKSGTGSWQASQAPTPASTKTGHLVAVACESADKCTAVGSSGRSALLVAGVGQTWTPVGVPVPASSADGSRLAAVACPSRSSCVATGDYTVAGQQDGLLLSGEDSSWTATRAPLPANAGSRPDVSVQAVACPTTSHCLAVGQYSTGKSDDALLLTGSGSSWTGTRAPLPADAAASPAAQLVSVACPSVTSCTAVGSYLDDRGNRQGMLVTLHGTSWTATRSPLPSNASVPGAKLSAVACVSTAKCTAAGSYNGDSAGMLITGTGSSWNAAAVQLPSGAATDAKASFPGITCSAAGCVAVGSYLDRAGSSRGLIVFGNGSTPSATMAPLPSGAAVDQASPGARLTSVACVSATSCLAVGRYTDTAGDGQVLLLSGAGTSWKAVRAPAPGNAESVGSQAQGTLAPPSLSSVACPAASACVAVGTYPARKLGMAGLIIGGPV
jgi:hypothetical protein